MIKQYSSYLFLGLLICYANLFLWGFSAGPANILPYITFISSVLLFSIATGLLFYYPKIASIIGLLSTLGCSVMGDYIFGTLISGGGIYDVIAIVILALFLISITFSLKIIFNWSKPDELNKLSKMVKLCYALLPLLILLVWIILIYFQ